MKNLFSALLAAAFAFPAAAQSPLESAGSEPDACTQNPEACGPKPGRSRHLAPEVPLPAIRWKARKAEAPASDKRSSISPAEAFALIQRHNKDKKFTILDVRTPDEFRRDRLKDAQNLDLLGGVFEAKLPALDARKTYLLYCAVGGRSARALEMMKKRGIQDAYHLQGGFDRWRKDGLPTVNYPRG